MIMDTKDKIQHRPHHKPCAASPLIQSTGSHSIGWMGSIREKDSGHVNVHQGCASLSWGMMERLRAKFPNDEEFEVYISIRPANVEVEHE